MSEQLREYVRSLKKLKLNLDSREKRFHVLSDEIEAKYQSFYAIKQNSLNALNLSQEALLMDADLDTYLKWLLSNDNL